MVILLGSFGFLPSFDQTAHPPTVDDDFWYAHTGLQGSFPSLKQAFAGPMVVPDSYF